MKRFPPPLIDEVIHENDDDLELESLKKSIISGFDKSKKNS